MANEIRLIDANAFQFEPDPVDNVMNGVLFKGGSTGKTLQMVKYCLQAMIDNAPTVDAVEVKDKQLQKAIKLLIKQYEHSKNSDYVHSPVAHAFYHTWNQLDAKMDGDGNG